MGPRPPPLAVPSQRETLPSSQRHRRGRGAARPGLHPGNLVSGENGLWLPPVGQRLRDSPWTPGEKQVQTRVLKKGHFCDLPVGRTFAGNAAHRALMATTTPAAPTKVTH